MTLRAKFFKSEHEKIKKLLNVSFEYADYCQVEDNNRFKKMFELIMEIQSKSNTLRQVVTGSFVWS